MKKRLIKKMKSSVNLMGKRLSGRYAKTIANRIQRYTKYDSLMDLKFELESLKNDKSYVVATYLYPDPNEASGYADIGVFYICNAAHYEAA